MRSLQANFAFQYLLSLPRLFNLFSKLFQNSSPKKTIHERSETQKIEKRQRPLTIVSQFVRTNLLPKKMSPASPVCTELQKKYRQRWRPQVRFGRPSFSWI
ncbi:hypothetical protein ABFX02_11G086600 [Erythranthe guttata]